MTRKEEIWDAINNHQIGTYDENNQLDSDEYDGSDLQDAFYLGARWADNHPKSPWISVNDDLPCNYEEFTLKLRRVTKVVFVRTRKSTYFVNYMIKEKSKCKSKWKWFYDPTDIEDEIEYWMPIPELPK